MKENRELQKELKKFREKWDRDHKELKKLRKVAKELELDVEGSAWRSESLNLSKMTLNGDGGNNRSEILLLRNRLTMQRNENNHLKKMNTDLIEKIKLLRDNESSGSGSSSSYLGNKVFDL